MKVIEVTGKLVNGYDWKLTRELGKGTYALYAHKDENIGDVETVIEECEDNANREIWDNASNEKVIEWVYEIIKAIEA